MIKEKCIDLAAIEYCTKRYPSSLDAPFIAEGFRQGAAWMLKQLPKKKTIRVYLAALSSDGQMGMDSLDAVYAFSTMEERVKWAAEANGNEYDVSYFEDEIEIEL